MEDSGKLRKWSRSLSKKILDDNILSEEQITAIIEATIKSEIVGLLSAYMPYINNVFIAKKEQVLISAAGKRYFKVAAEFGLIKDKRNIAREVYKNLNTTHRFKQLKEFIKENYPELYPDLYRAFRDHEESKKSNEF